MIDLRTDSHLARWFVWSCDHLPWTVTYEYGKDKPSDGIRRTGAYYVENGTTLCHIFWACLWAPLVLAAFLVAFAFLFVMMHVHIYYEHSAQFGVAAAFIPEGLALGIALFIGVVILCLIGLDKGGLGKLVWTYLKSIKGRVCPLVKFETSP